MWSVIKIEKRKINIFKEELRKKIDQSCEFYIPKLHIEGVKNNKKINKQVHLLGDYIFCFNKKFEDKNILQHLKTIRGLKYFLDGFTSAQDEISHFIKKCKSFENSDGLIKQNFLNIYENKNYKFLSGPLAGTLLKVLELDKNKFSVLVGNVKVKINKKKYLFEPA